MGKEIGGNQCLIVTPLKEDETVDEDQRADQAQQERQRKRQAHRIFSHVRNRQDAAKK